MAKVRDDFPLDKASETMLDALLCILNVEGVAQAAVNLGAYKGLDVPYHFEQVREAIAAAYRAGVRDEWERPEAPAPRCSAFQCGRLFEGLSGGVQGCPVHGIRSAVVAS